MSDPHHQVRRACPVFFIMMLCVIVRAQPEPATGDTTVAFDIGRVCETVTDGEHSEELFEHLAWLLDHPLDLNRAEADDLVRIPGVSSGDVSLLLLLRARAGRFSRVQQLLRYGPDGVRLYHALAPFVGVERMDGPRARLRSRTGWRPIRSERTTTTGGPGFREYHRFDVQAGRGVSGGVIMVRDAGERYADAFFSGDIALSFHGAPVEQVIAGDFAVGCAHGLVFGQGGGGAGGIPGNSVRSGGLTMEPFHGSSGTRLLRGVGSTGSIRFRTGVLSLAGFVARTPFAASLDTDRKILSFDVDSDFSTPASLVRRNAIHEWSSGFRAAWISAAGLSCGLSVFWRRLSHPFIEETAFGKVADVRAVGCDASIVAGLAEFSAEGAWMKEGIGLSGRMGIMPAPEIRLSFAGWYFSPGFRPGKSGTGPGGGEATNEAGASLRWEIGLWQRVTCSGNVSHFRRPWRTYFDHMPPAGSEAGVSVSLPFSSKLILSARLATAAGESWEQERVTGCMPEAAMERSLRRTIRFTLACKLARDVRLQTRVEHVTATAFGPAQMEHGWMIFQEMHAALTPALTLDLRWTSVQTDSYTSRVYALERDVDGAFAGPPLYGTGIRWYLFLRYTPGPGLVLSGKYASAARTAGPFLSPADRTLTLQLDLTTGTSGRGR